MTQAGGRATEHAALGVFDSGLGGLTVVRALRERCPYEDIVYLGDTARVPYGTRSPNTVTQYALTCANELVDRGVKALVVACNTVSSVALDSLRAEFDLPITGVIEPGARAAVAVAGSHRIGVLGTSGTIASGAYARAVANLSSHAEVWGQPAPLLVALAEEGWTDGEVPRMVVERYLKRFFGPEEVVGLPRQAHVGCVVLGCTHFPLFRELIVKQMRELGGRGIPVVDSAVETANDVERFLTTHQMSKPSENRGRLDVLVTDMPESFERVASRFLGEPITHIEAVDLAVR